MLAQAAPREPLLAHPETFQYLLGDFQWHTELVKHCFVFLFLNIYSNTEALKEIKDGLRGYRFPYMLEYNLEYACLGWLGVIRSIWLFDESLQRDFRGWKGQRTIPFLRRHNLIKEDELASAVTYYAQQQIAPPCNHRSCPLAPVIFDRLTRNIIHTNVFGHLPRPEWDTAGGVIRRQMEEKKEEKRSLSTKVAVAVIAMAVRRWTHFNRRANKVCCCSLTVTAGKKWWPKKMQ